jgi:chromosome segregation ATPase
MKRKNSENLDLEASVRGARLVSGESEPDEASGFKLTLDREIADLNFRKSVHGYNIEDVKDYVEEQNKNFMSTCQMYDGKIAELRTEVAFLTRERDSLLSKLEEARNENNALKEELEQLKLAGQDEGEEKTAEEPVVGQAEIKRDRLDDDYRILVDEVAQLRREKVEAQSTIAQLAEIAADYESLSKQRDELEAKYNEQSQELLEKKDELTRLLAVERELKVAIDEAEGLKHACETEQKRRAEAEKELQEKTELMSKAVTEIEQLRKEISEFEIRQSVLRQQLKKSDEEIAEMREQNKRQAYDYAAKLSDLEAEFNRNKLAMQKQIQVHMYHIKQVDLLMNELQKQFGDAKSSLEVIEPSE